ncbi:MAG: epoxyqueuosine reductase, partial [Methanomicrobiales archaeon]|nr:epoxyqueuosine reductase [Methanomicrobiales archaeon]
MADNLARNLRILGESLGTDYFGIADLTPVRDFIRSQGGDRAARYPRSVVMGIRLQDSMVDMLADQDRE